MLGTALASAAEAGLGLGLPPEVPLARFITNLSGWKIGAEEFLGAVLESVAQPVWVVDPAA